MIIISRLSITRHKSLIYDNEQSLRRFDHEIRQILVRFDLAQVFLHQPVLLLAVEVLRRSAFRICACQLDDALQFVPVAHEHLLVVRFALNGVSGADEAGHPLEDLEFRPQLRVLHDEIIVAEEGDVLCLLGVSPIPEFSL